MRLVAACFLVAVLATQLRPAGCRQGWPWRLQREAPTLLMPLVQVPRRRRRPCLEVNTVRPKVALSRPKLTKLRYVKIVMFDEMEKCREAVCLCRLSSLTGVVDHLAVLSPELLPDPTESPEKVACLSCLSLLARTRDLESGNGTTQRPQSLLRTRERQTWVVF